MPYRFRGKYRKVKKPTLLDLFRMKNDFEREEQNMLILRHPYLTVEQSHGHIKAQENRKAMFLQKMEDFRREKFEKHTTIADRLSHMRVTEAWD